MRSASRTWVRSSTANRPSRTGLVRTLTVTALVCAFCVVLTCYYMLKPVNITGVGRLGYIALMLAPQLILLAIVAALLAWFAQSSRATFASRTFVFVAVMLALMAIWPTVAVWQRARAYNVPVSFTAMLVPEIGQHAFHPKETVLYETAPDGSKLLLDVWPAAGVAADKARPAIVKVHGGDWTGGYRGQSPEWNVYFTKLGYDVFDVDYRLPPPVRWKSEVGDVKCAVGWVVANASKYNVDTNRVSLMGYSAGANLALLTAYSMGDPQLPASCAVPSVKIRSVVELYGPTDMALLYTSTGSQSYLTPRMDAYIGGPPSKFADRYKLLSPVFRIHPRTPPTLILQGESDRVVPAEQSLILDYDLRAAHVYHETYYLPFADHGFDAVWNSIATQIARAKVKSFLQQHEAR